MDGYFEGIIDRTERDRRLVSIDANLQTTQAILLRESPAAAFDTAKPG